MDAFRDTQLTVSNLTPVWDGAASDDGGSFAPLAAGAAVERAVGTRVHEERAAASASPPVERPSPYAGIQEVAAPTAAAEAAVIVAAPHRATDEHGVLVDYSELPRRDIARELLRARLVSIAEQREHRSAYEIVFVLLAAAVAVLLAAPPLVQVLLAARGIQA